MKLHGKDIYKKSVRLNGKRINFIINFEIYHRRLETLRGVVLKKKAERSFGSFDEYRFYTPVFVHSSEEICLLSFEILIKTFKTILIKYFSFIDTPFHLYINFLPFDKKWACAESVSEISKPGYSFFNIGSHYLWGNFLIEFYGGDFPQELKEEYESAFSNPLLESIEHEFTHYLDLPFFKNREKTGKMFKSKRSLKETFFQFSMLRSEGLAEIVALSKKRHLPYSKSKIKDYKEGFGWGKVVGAEYYLGTLMYYFIGLYFLYEKRRKDYNGMKVYFSGREYWFLSYGINDILNKSDRIYFQNLPKDIIEDLLEETRKWSHIRFMKEYENACRKLGIEEKNMIFSFKEYQKIKKENYLAWERNVKKRKFQLVD